MGRKWQFYSHNGGKEMRVIYPHPAKLDGRFDFLFLPSTLTGIPESKEIPGFCEGAKIFAQFPHRQPCQKRSQSFGKICRRSCVCKGFWSAFLRVLFFGSGQFLVKSGAFDTRVGALRDLEVDLLPFFLDSLMSIKRRFDVLEM